MRALAMGSLTTVLTSVAIGLAGCGGSGKSPAGASASSTPPPFLAKFEKVLTSRFEHSGGRLPSADVPKLVNCVIKKLESQGVTTGNAPHGAHQARVDAVACGRALGLH